MLMAERRADDLHALAARDHGHPHQVGVVARDHLAPLGHLDPALLGQRRRVDEVHVLLGAAGEQAVEDGEGEQTRVALGDPAHVLDLDAVGGVAQRRGDRSQALGERDERAEHLHVLGGDRGDVHGSADHAAGERGDDLLGGLHAGAVLRLGGARRRGAA